MDFFLSIYVTVVKMIKRAMLAVVLGAVISACGAGQKEFDEIIKVQVTPPITRVDKQIAFQHADEKEVACLAQNLYFEARSQSDKEMVAIGYVVKNRVGKSIWPNTWCEVIWQYRTIKGRKRPQFSWTLDGKSDVPHNEKEWSRSKKIAYKVYWSEVSNPIGRADHYYANYVNPVWAKSMFKTATIGAHHFMDSTRSPAITVATK